MEGGRKRREKKGGEGGECKAGVGSGTAGA
jgi:hypothetical protein